MDKKATTYFYYLLIINTLLRVCIAAFTDLGTDEAYYFCYGLYLDWSYFDHPIMIGLLAKASTIISHAGSAFGFRVFPLIIGTVNLILVFKIAKTISGNRAGFIAALLFSASFYGSVISGGFTLPDNPLTLFWLLSVFCVVKFIQAKKKNWLYIIFFGVFAGLAFLSKYSALFLWLGLAVFAMIYNGRYLLKKPYFYVAAVISIILFLPVILWNYYNAYESFSFHGNRIAGGHIRLDYFATELFGQVFYNNPVNVFIIISSIVYFFRNRRSLNTPVYSFLLLISIPLIITTLFISFFNRTLPHWSGPGYLGLIIFSSIILDNKHKNNFMQAIKKGVAGNIFFIVVVVLALFEINTGFIPTANNSDKEKLGKNDISLDLYGWKQIQKKTFELINHDLETNKTENNFVLITHNWFPAGSIEFYIAQPLNKKLYIWGSKEKAHQYIKINKQRGKIALNADAYYITTSRYFKAPDEQLQNYFEQYENPQLIEVTRNSKPAFYVFIYRLKKAKCDFIIKNEDH